MKNSTFKRKLEGKEYDITHAISEIKLSINLIKTFKEMNNWKLLGFEIPLHNSLKILESVLSAKEKAKKEILKEIDERINDLPNVSGMNPIFERVCKNCYTKAKQIIKEHL